MRYISSLDQEHRLWIWLHHASHLVYRAREKEVSQYRIPLMQAGVLFAVQNARQPVTAARIARWFLREPHSVHALLDRMIQQGLIYKTKDPQNKRIVKITLTEQGCKLYDELYNKPLKDDVLNRVFSNLSTPEQLQLEYLLRRVLHATLDELNMHKSFRYF